MASAASRSGMWWIWMFCRVVMWPLFIGRVALHHVAEGLHLLRRDAAEGQLHPDHLHVRLALSVHALLEAEADELAPRSGRRRGTFFASTSKSSNSRASIGMMYPGHVVVDLRILSEPFLPLGAGCADTGSMRAGPPPSGRMRATKQQNPVGFLQIAVRTGGYAIFQGPSALGGEGADQPVDLAPGVEARGPNAHERHGIRSHAGQDAVPRAQSAHHLGGRAPRDLQAHHAVPSAPPGLRSASPGTSAMRFRSRRLSARVRLAMRWGPIAWWKAKAAGERPGGIEGMEPTRRH